jgi:hypothetical protein
MSVIHISTSSAIKTINIIIQKQLKLNKTLTRRIVIDNIDLFRFSSFQSKQEKTPYTRKNLKIVIVKVIVNQMEFNIMEIYVCKRTNIINFTPKILDYETLDEYRDGNIKTWSDVFDYLKVTVNKYTNSCIDYYIRDGVNFI